MVDKKRKIRLDTIDPPISSEGDREESSSKQKLKEDDHEEEKDKGEKDDEEEDKDEKNHREEEGQQEVKQASPPETVAVEKKSPPGKRKRQPKTLGQGLPEVKTREERKRLLKKLLLERGLALREDSRLCEQYLKGGVEMDVVALADIMQEMDWYFKNTGYSSLARTTPSADAKFSSLKWWVAQLFERNKKDGEKANAEYLALADGKRPPNSLWRVIDDMLETLEEGESIERSGGWVREFDVDRRLYSAK